MCGWLTTNTKNMNAEQFYRKHFYLESKREFEDNKTVSKEGCLNVMAKFAEQEVNEHKEIWSKQEKDLCDMIVEANNTIADLKERVRRELSYRLELIKQAECTHEIMNKRQCAACGYIAIWEE